MTTRPAAGLHEVLAKAQARRSASRSDFEAALMPMPCACSLLKYSIPTFADAQASEIFA